VRSAVARNSNPAYAISIASPGLAGRGMVVILMITSDQERASDGRLAVLVHVRVFRRGGHERGRRVEAGPFGTKDL
jgi:hypothetical protein